MTDLDDAMKRLREDISVESSVFKVSKADIRTVLDALSEAQSEIEGLNREWRETLDMTQEVIQQRDEALAVIERIDGEVKDFGQSDNDALSAIEHILSKVAPVDALRERDAETRAGFADELTRMGVHTFDIHSIRKYARKEQTDGTN